MSRFGSLPIGWCIGALTIALSLVAAPLAAQESIDDLFNDPEMGIVEDETEEAVDPDELTTLTTSIFSGSVSAEAGLAGGLLDWTWPIDPVDDLSLSPYYAMGTTLRLDARPTPTTRFFARIGAEVPDGGSLVFDALEIEELFLDYTFADTVFFRVGKQSLTWGNGEIFNPANLATEVSDSTSIKASLPVGPLATTLVAIAKDSFFTDPELPGIAEVGVAGLVEGSVSPVSMGVSSAFQSNDGLRVAAYAKSVLFGMDVLAEGTARWNPSFASAEWSALTGLYWEGTNIGLVLVGEYLVESERLSDGFGSTIGIGVGARDLLRDGWNPGLQWLHAFFDGSGEVTLGLEGTLGNNLDVSFGLPIVYGPVGTTYREDGADPENRVIAGLVQFSVSVSF